MKNFELLVNFLVENIIGPKISLKMYWLSQVNHELSSQVNLLLKNYKRAGKIFQVKFFGKSQVQFFKSQVKFTILLQLKWWSCKKFYETCDFFIVTNRGSLIFGRDPARALFIDPLRLIIGQHPIDLSCGRSSRNRLTAHRREILSSMPQTGRKQSCKLSPRVAVFGSSVQYRASSWPRENWKENKSTISVINWLNMERQNEWNHSRTMKHWRKSLTTASYYLIPKRADWKRRKPSMNKINFFSKSSSTDPVSSLLPAAVSAFFTLDCSRDETFFHWNDFFFLSLANTNFSEDLQVPSRCCRTGIETMHLDRR